MLAPFTTDASEYRELQSGKPINIGYVPPQDLPVYKGAAFSKNGDTARGQEHAFAGEQLQPRSAYPWGVNYFALNYTNPISGPIFKQLYIRQAMQSLMNQTLWIQLFNAGYGAPTYGPVPVYPPTDLATQAGELEPVPLQPPARRVSLLSSHGWKVVPSGVTTCVKPGTKARRVRSGHPPRARP